MLTAAAMLGCFRLRGVQFDTLKLSTVCVCLELVMAALRVLPVRLSGVLSAYSSVPVPGRNEKVQGNQNWRERFPGHE